MKFCEVSWILISNWTWKFQLSTLKNKKVLFLKKKFLSCTAKIHPKDGVNRLNFLKGFACAQEKIKAQYLLIQRAMCQVLPYFWSAAPWKKRECTPIFAPYFLKECAPLSLFQKKIGTLLTPILKKMEDLPKIITKRCKYGVGLVKLGFLAILIKQSFGSFGHILVINFFWRYPPWTSNFVSRQSDEIKLTAYLRIWTTSVRNIITKE